eukprot:8320579-Pyramimonas_sp.AAC.1
MRPVNAKSCANNWIGGLQAHLSWFFAEVLLLTVQHTSGGGLSGRACQFLSRKAMRGNLRTKEAEHDEPEHGQNEKNAGANKDIETEGRIYSIILFASR